MRAALRSPWDREIARLAVPALGALIAEPLYVLSDTAIVGHLGTPQLAGLAVAAAILVTGYSVLQLLRRRLDRPDGAHSRGRRQRPGPHLVAARALGGAGAVKAGACAIAQRRRRRP